MDTMGNLSQFIAVLTTICGLLFFMSVQFIYEEVEWTSWLILNFVLGVEFTFSAVKKLKRCLLLGCC